MEHSIVLKNITKRFGTVIANNNITMKLDAKKVHAIVGENGAGKSTLMSILSGINRMDEGEIYIDNELQNFDSPRKAVEKGIGMVYQEFMLARKLSVLDNIILGYEPGKANVIDKNTARKKIERIMSRYNLKVDLDTIVEDMPISLQQRVEILKVLYRGADVIILDEPTAVLTPQETEGLFRAIRELVKKGKTIIFISHKLKEVIELSDNIFVLRDGKFAGQLSACEATERMIAELMVGKEVFLQPKKSKKVTKKTILQLENIHYEDVNKTKKVNDISLNIRAGEILGIAGVAGNGQNELISSIIGLIKPSAGKIILNNVDITYDSVKQRREKGISYIPQDRIWIGSSMESTIWENLIITYEHNEPISTNGFLNYDEIDKFCKRLIKKFNIKIPSKYNLAKNLSGGNLQKLIIARELTNFPSLIIAEDPTRGLDVGASEFVHDQIIQAAENGCAILLVSQDLQEIMNLSNRIVVIYKGSIMKVCDSEQVTREQIGLLMGGVNIEQGG